jgi:hypothetical protein
MPPAPPEQVNSSRANLTPDAQSALRGTWAATISAGAAVLLAAGVLLHIHGLNGPAYWKWDWIRLPLGWYPWMLLAATPAALALAITAIGCRRGCRSPWQRSVALALLALAVAMMKLASQSCAVGEFSTQRIAQLVAGADTTSYYTDAQFIASMPPGSSWLAIYPDLLPRFHTHTRNKPPGPLSYYLLFVRAMGYGPRSAAAAGLVLALLAALAVPAIYWLALTLGADRDVGWIAAVLLTFCPGFVLVYPTLDAAYVGLVALLLICWHKALRSTGPGPWAAAAWSLAAGLVLSMILYLTYAPLVIGFFMAADALLAMANRRVAPAGVFGRSALVLATAILAYAVLYALTGFDPIRTFEVALQDQNQLVRQGVLQRPYPWTILFDLTDFALGAAWIVLIPATMAACNAIRGIARRQSATIGLPPWLILVMLAQPLLVAITALAQTETARLWNFMLPMILIPAAVELARWRPRARGIFYGAMLILLLVLGQNMLFMGPPLALAR